MATTPPTEDKVKKIFQAVQRNDLTRVKFLVQFEEIPATVTNVGKETLAHIAARSGFFDIVAYLAETAPSLVHAVDEDGYNILQLAIEEGHTKMVKYLVEKFALDLHKPSKHGWGTPIHTAVEFDRLGILKYFIDEKKGDINVRGKIEDLPPVFLAVRYSYEDIIHYLVEEKQANMTLLDSNKENILYIMVRKNDLPFMRRLLDEDKLDYDIDQRNYLGETLVYTAVFKNRMKILKYLVEEKRANVNLPTKRDGMTPLHWAAAADRFEMCEYLIENGANPELKDAKKQLPASKTNDTRLMEYLAEKAVKHFRSQRSVNSHQPLLLPTERTNIREKGESQRLGGRSNSALVGNFQALAHVVVAYMGRRSERHTIVSPRSVLQERMDPKAVDAVFTPPDFSE